MTPPLVIGGGVCVRDIILFYFSTILEKIIFSLPEFSPSFKIKIVFEGRILFMTTDLFKHIHDPRINIVENLIWLKVKLQKF